jgi:lactoylglutathione lyase
MAKVIHSMIRVLDEEKSTTFYRTAFGLALFERFEFDGFTLCYLRNEETDFEVELTINTSQSSPYTHGDGYGHIAVCVDDLDSEFTRFSALGCNPTAIKEFAPEGVLMAKFFFVQDPDGYKIEVLQRHGRYR